MDRSRAGSEVLEGSIKEGVGVLQPSTVAPFLKWAGGKRWFVEKCAHLIPLSFRNYIEPFLGSGAVFFHVAPRHGFLSDKNAELVETYQVVRDDWESVLDELTIHHRKHSASHYYRVRSSKPRLSVKKAARFIYLNRTCWNGLYRVNKHGSFNVPVGTKLNVILPTDNFAAVAGLLRKMTIHSCDYLDAISRAEKEDFLFVDPPYVTKRHNGSFIKYNEKLFAWNDQIALRDALVGARRRGAKILATNANNKVIRRLYENDFDVTTATRSSVISGANEGRGRCSELVIRA
jgi:DNA adenine methylase